MRKELILPDETLDEIGGVRLIQRRDGYRFTSDPFSLVSFADLANVTTAIDLGTGCGVIAILLASKAKSMKVVGLELQAGLYDIASRNVLLSGLSDRVSIINGDIRDVRSIFGEKSFDLVISNPPYYAAGSGRLGPNTERNIARHELAIGMEDVVSAARYLLRDGGRVVMIYPTDKVVGLLGCMKEAEIGPRRLRSITSNPPGLTMIEGETGYLGEVVEGSAPDF